MDISIEICLLWIYFRSAAVLCASTGCHQLNAEDISVCKTSTLPVTNSTVLIHARRAPRGVLLLRCNCIVEHKYDTGMVINTEFDIDGQHVTSYLKLLGNNFKRNGNHTLSDKTTVLHFEIATVPSAPGCFVITPLNGAIISVKCLTQEDSGEDNTDTQTTPTTKAWTITDQGTGATVKHKTKNDNTDNDGGDPSIVLIAGGVCGGAIVVIVFVIVAIVCKRRMRTQDSSKAINTEGKQSSDYDMTENAMYNCDESDNNPKTNSTAAKEVEYEYITSDVSKSSGAGSGAYDNAIEQKTRPNNDLHLENENEYNHVDQSHTKTSPNTGNIYNVLKSGNTKENNLDENDYDCTNNSNMNYRQNATSLYSKAV